MKILTITVSDEFAEKLEKVRSIVGDDDLGTIIEQTDGWAAELADETSWAGNWNIYLESVYWDTKAEAERTAMQLRARLDGSVDVFPCKQGYEIRLSPRGGRVFEIVTA